MAAKPLPLHFTTNKSISSSSSSSSSCVLLTNFCHGGRIHNRLFLSNFGSLQGTTINSRSTTATATTRGRLRAIKEKAEENNASSSPEDITQKFGLEAGLWQIFSSKEDEKEGNEKKKSKGDQAKELLAKYGGAYLATSITLSLISFTLCYTLISAGVDVQSLLQKLGISASETGEKVGTFALAYAAHKAASPIRFPPTVALTPIVANWIGKKVDKEN